MPFYDTTSPEAEVIEFRFVNEDDPEGRHGLIPPSWDTSSVWRFARYKNQEDDDVIARKVSKIKYKSDRKAARKMGRNYIPDMESESIMSALMALLTTMSRGWEGPEFAIPPGAKDQNGRPIPGAGHATAPCTAYWISRRHPRELATIERFLDQLYEPEAPEDEARFQKPRQEAARSEAAEGPEADFGDRAGFALDRAAG